MSFKSPRRPQFFYTTAPLPCPYVPGRTERKVVTEVSGAEAEASHDRLSRAGFRRSHNIAYAPVCPGCNACVPIRIPVADFSHERGHRRILRANADLQGVEAAPRATAEQFQLFQRYQQARHTDGDMATMSFYDYRAMVEDTPIDTTIIEFREPDGRLLGACLTDKLSDGLSAVYSYFLPDTERRSLGSFTILWLIGSNTPAHSGCPIFTSATGCQKAARWPTRPGIAPAKSCKAVLGGGWRRPISRWTARQGIGKL